MIGDSLAEESELAVLGDPERPSLQLCLWGTRGRSKTARSVLSPCWSNMKSRMPNSHTLLALLLSGAAVGAQEIQPVIDRPLTLPKGRLDLTLHGTYTNWGNSNSVGAPAH